MHSWYLYLLNGYTTFWSYNKVIKENKMQCKIFACKKHFSESLSSLNFARIFSSNDWDVFSTAHSSWTIEYPLFCDREYFEDVVFPFCSVWLEYRFAGKRKKECSDEKKTRSKAKIETVLLTVRKKKRIWSSLASRDFHSLKIKTFGKQFEQIVVLK